MPETLIIRLPVKANVPDGEQKECQLIDWRFENPALHRLYVQRAVIALSKIDDSLIRLNKLSSTRLASMICAIYKEREDLVLRDTSYYEAHNILASIGRLKRVGLQALPDLPGK